MYQWGKVETPNPRRETPRGMIGDASFQPALKSPYERNCKLVVAFQTTLLDIPPLDKRATLSYLHHNPTTKESSKALSYQEFRSTPNVFQDTTSIFNTRIPLL
jgi:hypothetical protein